MAKKPKHKGTKKPKWTRANPAAGQHGVPDKGAYKVGQQWEKENKKDGK